MIVHLTGSKWDVTDDLPYLRAIVRALNENDAVLARDWIEVAHHQARKSGQAAKDLLGHSQIMEENLEAIGRADLVIVEATNYSFTQGFQVAMALQQKKPVLVVSRQPIQWRTIAGYKNHYLRVAEYGTEAEVSKIAATFIQENTVSTKELRFNMFIDRQIYGYLRNESLETGKNKSEIIRDLIKQEMKKKRD